MSASIVGSTKLDPSLNYKQIDSSKSLKQYRKLYPANGGQRSLVLGFAGAVQNVIFNIPVECENMGDSYLEYNLTIPAQAAGTYIWQYKDKHGEIDSIMYRDTGSQSIVDIKNMHLYQEATNRLNFSKQYLDYNDALNGLVKTNALLSDVKSIRFDGTTCSQAFIEPQQLEMIGTGPGLISRVINKKIYLKDLCPDTYFGLSKNQILPVETYLDISFSNASGRIGFTSRSAVDPTNTPLHFTVDATGGAYNINGLTLNLCVEQNQDLVTIMKQEIAKGMTIPINVVKMHQLSSGAAANSFVYNLPLDNKQHGHKIKRIIYLPLVSAPAANTLYDHTNINGSKIVSYQTELDNQKLQRDIIRISATENDDYMNNLSLLKGSLYFNQAIYNQNWLHVDSWSYNDRHDQVGGGAIMVDGLTLDKPMTYTMNVLSCATGSYMNTAVVCGMKSLVISATGFLVA